MGEIIYEIHPNLCTECVGHYDQPQCQLFCPVDCIPLDPQHVESQDELMDILKKIDGIFPKDGNRASRRSRKTWKR